MKENKIAFISCVNDEVLYERSLSFINKLQVPKDIEIEILPIRGAKSLTSAYNQMMQKSDAKYKVYLHQDVYIQNINFINDILNILKSDLNIGLIGMIGAKAIPASGVWWETLETVGKVIDTQHGSMQLIEGNLIINRTVEEVKGIDGLIMITQYDIPWREDIFDGWHFYDISQCVEFTRKNFKIVVPSQQTSWCIHDCGYSDVGEYCIYEKYRAKFLDNYSKDILP